MQDLRQHKVDEPYINVLKDIYRNSRFHSAFTSVSRLQRGEGMREENNRERDKGKETGNVAN